MRISTTLLIIVCTVLFFGASFEAKAQAPVFTVTNLHHTCGPGNPATGSLVVNITAADPTQDSLTVLIYLGAVVVKQVSIKPVPIASIASPYVQTITGLTGTPGGRSYLVIVADENNSSVASNGPNFTMYNFSAALNGTPANNTNADCTAPNGAINVTLTGTSSALPIVYSWSGPAGFVDPGTKDISGLRGGNYTLTYKDSNSPATQCTLGPITITDPGPAAFSITGPANICAGDPLSINVSATTTGYTYSVLEGATVLATQAGTGSSMFITVPAASISTTGAHTLKVQAVQGSCLPKNNNAPDLTVTVNPTPTYTGNTTTSVCSGLAIGVNLASFKSGGTDATSFVIQSISPNGMTSTNAVVGTVFASDLADDIWKNTSSSQQSVTYTIVPRINSCPGAQFLVTVPVDPQPDFNDLNATAVCSSTAIAVTLDGQKKASSAAAASYLITAINPNGMTRAGGTSAVGAATNTSIQADKWLNTTSGSLDVVYSIRPVGAGGCQGNIFTVTVPITPQPAYTSFSVTPGVCSQNALGVDLTGKQNSGTIAATSFLVMNVNPHGMTAVGTVTANGDNISNTDLGDDKWKNGSNANLTVDYDLQPSVGGCAGATFTVSVTVMPEPDYNLTNSPAAICSDASTAVNLDSFKKVTSIVATTYDITAITPDPSLTAKAVNMTLPRANKLNTEIANDQWENLTATARTVDYTVIPYNGTCVGTAFTVTITVSPEPKVNNYNSSPGGACSGDAIAIDFTTLAVGGSVAADSYKINTITATGLTPAGGNSTAGSTGSATMISTDKYTNTSSGSLPVSYNVTPFKGTCAGDPFDVVVLIMPRPSYASFSNTSGICATAIGLDLSSQLNPGSVSATSFTIQSITSTGLTKVGAPYGAFPITGLASNAIAGDMWSNPSTGNLDVDYAIIPLNGTCDGAVFHVVFTIKPQPVYNPGTSTICSNTQLNYDLLTNKAASSAAATTYTISIAPDPALSNSSATPTGVNASSLTDKWRNFTANPADVTYTVTPSTNGCDGGQFTVKFTINPEPVYTNTTLPAICSDTAIGFDLETVFSGTSVQATAFSYTYVADAGLTSAVPATGTGDRNLISTHQWKNTTAGNLQVVYSITPKSAANCDGAIFKVTVVISPQPDYHDQAVGNVCGESPLNIDLAALKKSTSVTADSFVGVSITTDNPITTPPGAPSIVGGKLMDVWSNTSSVAVTITYKIRPVTGTCQGDPFTITVTIQPEPDYNTTSKPLCSRDPLGIDLDGLKKATSSVADSYTINSITYDPLMLTSTGTALTTGPGLATGAITGHAFKNVTAAVQDVVYKIVPVKNGCNGPEFQITIHVAPEPKGANDVGTSCSGIAASYDLQNNITTLGNGLASVTFSWVAADNTNVTGETLVTPKTTATIDDNLVNNTSANQVVVYTVTPTSAGGCAGASFNVSITVNPKPVLAAGQTAQVCSGTAVGYFFVLNPVNQPAGTTFSWVANDNPSVTGEATGTQTTSTINDVLINNGATPQDVTYVVTPIFNGCSGAPVNVVITVNQAAVANAGNDQAICNDNGPYTLTGSSVSGSASTGTWSLTSQPAGGDGVISVLTPMATPSTATFTATVAGAYVLTLTTDDPAGVCGPVSDAVTITVTGKPVIAPGQTKLVCANDPVGYEILLTPANLPLNTVFNWADPDGPAGATNASAGTNVAMGTPGTIHINDVLRNQGTSNIDVTYAVTPSVGICVGAQTNIVITVKPAPNVAFGQSKTICSGDRVNYEILLSPANTPAGTTFSWPDPDGSGSAKSKLNVAADPAGTLHITDTLYNGSGAPIHVVYSVISRGTNGCIGITRDVDITVNSGAVAEAGNAQVICSNGTATLRGSSVGGLATQGTWSILSGPAGGDGVITNGTATTTPSAATFKATIGGTYTLLLMTDDPAGSCPAASDVVVITVKNPGDPSCTGGTGTCSTVSIQPVPTPATCNNSDGSVFFNINPAVPISGNVTITIDGTGSTVLPSPRTNINNPTFNVLSVGTYSYSIIYGDASCTKTGVFSIDRSGTVGTPTATNIINPNCFGGTATVTLDAPAQTGNTLQWSVDGVTWTNFVGGTPVSGIPSTASIINVKRAGDACAGAVSVSMTTPRDITATLTPVDATCSNNDGKLRISQLKGGSPGYTFILNSAIVNVPSDSTFKGLTADLYTLLIQDSKGCVKSFNPVTVSFPGYVNHTTPVISPADCSGGGSNGKVSLTITDPGSFEYVITTDLVVAPTTGFNQLGGSLVSVSNLTQGNYALWLRPVGAGIRCATKVDVTVTGIYAVSYTATTSDLICFSQATSIVVDNLKGAPNRPFTYTLTKSDNSTQSGTIPANVPTYSIPLSIAGKYTLVIGQDQSSIVPTCTSPVNGSPVALTIAGPTGLLAVTASDSTRSVPDLPSGSVLVDVAPSGMEPYDTQLELVTPAIPGQTYFSGFAGITRNTNNNKFEQRYSDLYAGLYTLTVRDDAGCKKTTTFVIGVDTDLFIPNIFTPNGDGSNEVFYIRNLPAADAKLLIANRWGKEVYKSSSYKNDWNGGDTVDGMYYYTLNIAGKKYAGWVEILRGQ